MTGQRRTRGRVQRPTRALSPSVCPATACQKQTPGRRSQRRAAPINSAPRLTEVRLAPVVQDRKRLEPSQVLELIRSLYADELKPFGRILRKRVSERVSGGLDQAAFGITQVHTACLALGARGLLSMHPEDGGDWSVLLTNVPASFVDVYSNNDLYPPSFWHHFSSYLESLDGEDMKLPGGRYSCAQAIVERRLPFFEGFSLGRICHIVQLAVSQRKLLGYLQGALVPYGHSQSKVKDECALQQQACAGARELSHLPLASWDTARTSMREILAAAVLEGSSPVPISSVKRLFQTRCDLELSETTLGHTKLTDLLQDVRFSDICTVQLQAQGYMVVPATGDEDTPPASNPEAPSQTQRVVFCEDEPLCFEDDEAETSVESSSSPPSRYPCLSPSVLSKDGTVGKLVHNTFIHQSAPPLTPLPGARRRASSLPKDFGSDKNAWETTCHALSFLHQAVSGEDRLTLEAAGSNVSEANTGSCVWTPSSCRQSPAVPQKTPTRSSEDPLKLLLAQCATAGSLEGDSL